MWHIFIFRTIFFNKMDGPLHGCNNIIYLDFSNNYCHHISPQALQIQTQLRVLNFSRNYVGQSFQDDNSGEIMGRNSKLAFLNLHDNKITTLPRHVFIHNSMIKYLNISNNRLDTWSVDLCHMSQLQLLDLSYNLISELNESAIDCISQAQKILYCFSRKSFILFVQEPFLFKLDK